MRNAETLKPPSLLRRSSCTSSSRAPSRPCPCPCACPCPCPEKGRGVCEGVWGWRGRAPLLALLSLLGVEAEAGAVFGSARPPLPFAPAPAPGAGAAVAWGRALTSALGAWGFKFEFWLELGRGGGGGSSRKSAACGGAEARSHTSNPSSSTLPPPTDQASATKPWWSADTRSRDGSSTCGSLFGC